MIKQNRKKLGAYYTPYLAAKLLADWAIENKKFKILEPSFGGCKFLKASEDRLTEIGCKKPFSNVYGYDIDETAFEKYLYGELDVDRSNTNFKKKNFLDSNYLDFKTKFDAIIGNPPYVSYHSLNVEERLKCKKVCQENNIDLKGKFSLWLPFVVKSIQHLKRGGNLAFILPSSLIESSYASGLVSFLESNFCEVKVVSLKERLFKDFGTNEISYFLFCKSFAKQSYKLGYKFYEANYLTEIQNIVFHNDDEKRLSAPTYVFNDIDRNDVNLLGDFFSVKIGLVTGYNDFFVLPRKKAEENLLPSSYLKNILRNSKIINSLSINDEYLETSYVDNKGFKLVYIEEDDKLNSIVDDYLKSIDKKIIDTNKTFAKRNPWYCINYETTPDFFMTYMNSDGPNIIINHSTASSTNSLYRLYSKFALTQKDKLILAISFQTSFSQLSAEILGKRYGSGVLKLEPSSAKKIQILKYNGNKNIRGIKRVFEAMNIAFSQNDSASVLRIADSFFMDSFDQKTLKKIQFQLQKIRSFRYNG